MGMDALSTTKKKNRSFVNGKCYTTRIAGQLDGETSMLVELTKSWSVVDFTALLNSERKCGLIVVCQDSVAPKFKDIIGTFDVILKIASDPQEDFEESNAIISVMNSPPLPPINLCLGSPTASPANDSLLREYFVEMRKVCGDSNEGSLYPVYDPSKQLSIGLSLSNAFAALNRSDAPTRIDVLLALSILELNLQSRFAQSVFGQAFPESTIVYNQGVPSPCPSEKSLKRHAPTSWNSNLLARYSDLYASIISQLGL